MCNVHHWIFDQTCFVLHKMNLEWPDFEFETQISLWNIDCIHLKMIFYIEYWNSRIFYINVLIWFIHFWKTLSTRKGPYFCRLICNPKQAYSKNYLFAPTFKVKMSILYAEHICAPQVWSHYCETFIDSFTWNMLLEITFQ